MSMDEGRDWTKWRLPVQSTENDIFTSGMLRDFGKWVLDLMRNIIVVGVIQYMAEKTGSIWVKAASFVSYGALILYCGSYIQIWTARVDIGKSHLMKISAAIVVSLVLIGLLVLMNAVLYRVVDEVAKSQMR
jgi:hydrogenase/urease accessory protein HupE